MKPCKLIYRRFGGTCRLHLHRRYWLFYPKEGGGNFLRNVSELLPYCKTVYRLWFKMTYGTSIRDPAMPSCKHRACVSAVIGACGLPHCLEKEGAVKLKKKTYPEQLIGSRDDEGRGLRPPPFFRALRNCYQRVLNGWGLGGKWRGK